MNKKKTVKIILKSGYEISILCDNFKVTYNSDTTVNGYRYEGLDTKNSINPVHININEIAAIISCP